MYFRYFIIISAWKKVGLSIWTNLNPLYPRMLCAKSDWNWHRGSGEEDEKVYDNNSDDDNDNDDGQRRIFNQKSSLELSAQVS